jgi:hypothetical protein
VRDLSLPSLTNFITGESFPSAQVAAGECLESQVALPTRRSQTEA